MDNVNFKAAKTALEDLFSDSKASRTPPELLALYAFVVGATTTFGGRRLYTRYLRRVANGDYVTPGMLEKKRWLKGVVTSVGDADNFRLYHTPAFGWRWPFKFRRVPSNAKDLKDRTLHIRIAGVDAPEAAHFGRPAQPYSEEALSWLRNKLLGKTVYCQLLRRDQYSRIVSIVTLPPLLLPRSIFTGKNLSIEMLKAGWVTTYEQAGAEYGQWGKEEFLRVESEAKAARRGMWQYGVGGETPADYKRRHAALESGASAGGSAGKSKASKAASAVSLKSKKALPRGSWFSRIWPN